MQKPTSSEVIKNRQYKPTISFIYDGADYDVVGRKKLF